MALNAYVMPLWRFKAGDFSSPIENAFGLKPEVISLADACKPPIPWHQRFLVKIGAIPENPAVAKLRKHGAAVGEVRKLKAEIAEMTGISIDWVDEGGVRYNKQFHEPVEMRAFAAWHEHQDELRVFAKPPEDNYYKHPVWSLSKPDQRRFPTLADHSLHNGYLLPVPFEGVHKVEPFMIHNHWKFYHFVASSEVMLREVTDFLGFLANMALSTNRIGESVSLERIQWYANELRTMCDLSLEHQLPVIFHG